MKAIKSTFPVQWNLCYLLGRELTYRIHLLFAHYQLDGNSVDASGNGRDGIFNGQITSTEDRFGVADNAVFIEPRGFVEVSNADALVPHSAGGGNVTYSMWVKPTSEGIVLNSYQHLNPGNSHFYFAVHEDRLILTGNGNDALDIPHVTSLDEWHHYVLTFDGDSNLGEIWVDGQTIGTGSLALNSSSTASSPFRIGFEPNAQINPNEGAIGVDDLKVFDRVLTGGGNQFDLSFNVKQSRCV